MRFRKKVRKKVSRKYFKKTSGTHRINVKSKPIMRGGIRL